MPAETLTTPPPQSFKEAYVDPINATTPPSEDKPATNALDITNLSKFSPHALEEVVVELRVKIGRVEKELKEIQTTIKHYTNFADVLRDKISFYFVLIAQIMQALPIPKPVTTPEKPIINLNEE